VTITIRELTKKDAAVLRSVAVDLFDEPLQPPLIAEFLADPRHHLVVALDQDLVVGFVSSVDYVHPDKPPELWINEVAVAPTHQRRGVATHMLDATLTMAGRLGCLQAWVLTDRSNAAALRLYASAGGEIDDKDTVMFNFEIDEP
jgi:ribosomal protein S18 acetylase RimI-like enzyme